MVGLRVAAVTNTQDDTLLLINPGLLMNLCQKPWRPGETWTYLMFKLQRAGTLSIQVQPSASAR